MVELIVQHVPAVGVPTFKCWVAGAPTKARLRTLTSPFATKVEGPPPSHLMSELRWYLEDFLDHPQPPNVARAARVRDAVRDWGRRAYSSLVPSELGSALAHLRVISTVPHILAWPWEALWHQTFGPIGPNWQISRALSLDTERPLVPSLGNTINILLISPRKADNDIPVGSVARSLLCSPTGNRRIALHLLRPATFAQLTSHLADTARVYDLVHFDGHGLFEPHIGGMLQFETDDGRTDFVSGADLGALLAAHKLRTVVLSACRSAMSVHDNPDSVASVVAGLLRAGCHTVVAMSHALYVSGARHFFREFYNTLSTHDDFSVAVLAGRTEMKRQNQRISSLGAHELDDWLVPVLYEHATRATSPPVLPDVVAAKADANLVPPPIESSLIGRDADIRRLEQALRAAPSIVVVHGLRGVGKTALTTFFLQWLRATDASVEWFCSDRFSTEQTHDALLRSLASALSVDDSTAPATIEQLAQILHDRAGVVLFNDCELQELDPRTRSAVMSLGRALDGGRSKLIVTTRAPESWSDMAAVTLLMLSGLQNEDLWAFAESKTPLQSPSNQRRNTHISEICDRFDGHPVAIDTLLGLAEQDQTASILEALRGTLASAPVSEALGQVLEPYVALLGGLSERGRSLVPGLAWQGVVLQEDVFARMVYEVLGRVDFVDVFRQLSEIGLVTSGSGERRIHPFLPLACRLYSAKHITAELRDAWKRACVVAVSEWVRSSGLLSSPIPTSIGPARIGIEIAWELAAQLVMEADLEDLSECLARDAVARDDAAAATAIHERLFEMGSRTGDTRLLRTASLRLSSEALERGDNAAAAKHARTVLKLSDDEPVAYVLAAQNLAHTFTALGNFDGGDTWFRRAFSVAQRINDKALLSMVCHNLGTMFLHQERGASEAGDWLRKAAALKEECKDHSLYVTYQALGGLAELRGDKALAEQWFRKALGEASIRLADDAVASSCTSLGQLSAERGRLQEANQYFLRALELATGMHNEGAAAEACRALGDLASKHHDLTVAREWYQRAAAIHERLGDHDRLAPLAATLGMLDIEVPEPPHIQRALVQEDYIEACKWLILSVRLYTRYGSGVRAAMGQSIVASIYRSLPSDLKDRVVVMWQDAGLGAFETESRIQPHGRSFVEKARGVLNGLISR